MVMEVTEQIIRVYEGEVYAKLWQPQSWTSLSPVIRFHDSVGCVEMWRQFPEALADRLGRGVIAYDQLGFGKSSSRSGLPSVRFVLEEVEI